MREVDNIILENVKEEDLKGYRKKSLVVGAMFSIVALSIMVLLFISIHAYGENDIITVMISYLMVIFTLSLVVSVIITRLVEAKLSRCGCLEIGVCQKGSCKYPWSSCLIVAKFNYIICKNFIHDITEGIERMVEIDTINKID